MANGTTEGLKLAANVAAMLLVFFSFIALFNYVFLRIGDATGLNTWVASVSHGNFRSLSLEFILGYTFAPLMWLMGVAGEDITLTGRLVGEKLIASEFVGYESLAQLKSTGAFAYQRSIVMATYMLCGFANFASIGIQIGVQDSLPRALLSLELYAFVALDLLEEGTTDEFVAWALRAREAATEAERHRTRPSSWDAAAPPPATMVLSQEEQHAFAALLQSPPEPTDRLRRLLGSGRS